MKSLRAALVLLFAFVGIAHAADVDTWNETASSNTSTAPDGFPENTAPNLVDDWGREIMGAVKRWYDRAQPVVTSGGAANAQTLTLTVGPASYVAGDTYTFIAGFTNTGATTLQVNALAATAVQNNGSALTGGEIIAGQVVTVYYTGSVFALLRSALQFKPTTVGALPPCTLTDGLAYFVIDASAPTWNAILAGGGTSTALAVCDGANWRAH